ncbi:MAG: hypothetical protein IT259_07140 [Saprospiraceae bacterium]|nr:hypothetical protein [Saprospiraceae bacterium]
MTVTNVTSYDYIFTGAGLAGLSLATDMVERPFFQGKKILLLDRDDKVKNDRTWCFWAREEEPLPPVIYRRWEHCHFFGQQFHRVLDFNPYRYHMIRGKDFYQWARETLARHASVHWLKTEVQEIDAVKGLVRTAEGTFQADWIFNSAFVHTPVLPEKFALFSAPFTQKETTAAYGLKLLQHFKGWTIRTEKPVFDPQTPVFMDFRPEQHGETRFVYVLPFSSTEALVEFTLFSANLLTKEAYESELHRYLELHYPGAGYQIEEEEFGIIPMTDTPFPVRSAGKLIHIGTAGGFVKASSGYAFLRTQRKLRALLDHWERNGAPEPALMQSPKRFRVLDSIFLRVLADRGELGHEIFTRLFSRLPAPLVLRFLDEDATFADILRVVSAPPTGAFLTAAVRQMPNFHRV